MRLSLPTLVLLVCSASAMAGNSGSFIDASLFNGVHATVDGVYNPAEYDLDPIPMSTATGAGGVLHSPSALFFNLQGFDVGPVTVGFQPGAALNDTVIIMLSYASGGRTRGSSGGVVAINDTADAARRALSNLQGTYPTGNPTTTADGFGADAAITINADGFGFFLFPDDQHATFTQLGGYTGVTNAVTGFREAAFPSSYFNTPIAGIDFAVLYAGDSFLYNEAAPSQPYSGGPSPGGQAAGSVSYENFYQLGVFIPAPGAAVMLCAGCAAFMRRRRA